ncbi:MAG TPA: GNAT family acetyltransferase [Rariglobus sp.]|jgi:ribosomal protein S18 acetylase RimI-like enzyme|nr:GNAT family acetyltransferase [Rariglobus sp.]
MIAAPDIRCFDQDKDHASVVALWTSVLGYGLAHNAPVLSIRKKVEADDGLFFVAEVDGRLIGTVMAGYDGHRGWIYSLAVEPLHRNRGVGRALLRHAETALMDRGCVKINLQIAVGNEAVIGFYEKTGYKVEPRTSMGKVLNGG